MKSPLTFSLPSPFTVLPLPMLESLSTVTLSLPAPEDPADGGAAPPKQRVIERVKRTVLRNSTYIQFQMHSGNKLFVANGVAFLERIDGGKEPLCEKDVTCSAFTVDDADKAEFYLDSAQKSLCGAGFFDFCDSATARRKLADTTCPLKMKEVMSPKPEPEPEPSPSPEPERRLTEEDEDPFLVPRPNGRALEPEPSPSPAPDSCEELMASEYSRSCAMKKDDFPGATCGEPEGC